MLMQEKIPTNIIIKCSYNFTKELLKPHYLYSIIDQIMEYIYQNPKSYENLEIEAKLGRFEFKGDSVRAFEKINEIFIIPESIKPSNHLNKYQFNAGIPQKDFFLIWSALDKESKLIGSNINSFKPQIYQDVIYNTNKRRSLMFEDGQAIKEEIIRKENKKHINVRNGGYDFRITCSEEKPTEIDENEDVKTNERDKFRISYQMSYYRVDLTISKEPNKNEYGYEVEIELNKLKSELINVKKIDDNKIRTILDRFIQNIMNLYSVLMPGAIYNNLHHEEQLNNSLGLGKNLNSSEIESRFGNYFKNNLSRK